MYRTLRLWSNDSLVMPWYCAWETRVPQQQRISIKWPPYPTSATGWSCSFAIDCLLRWGQVSSFSMTAHWFLCHAHLCNSLAGSIPSLCSPTAGWSPTTPLSKVIRKTLFGPVLHTRSGYVHMHSSLRQQFWKMAWKPKGISLLACSCYRPSRHLELCSNTGVPIGTRLSVVWGSEWATGAVAVRMSISNLVGNGSHAWSEFMSDLSLAV